MHLYLLPFWKQKQVYTGCLSSIKLGVSLSLMYHSDPVLVFHKVLSVLGTVCEPENL